MGNDAIDRLAVVLRGDVQRQHGDRQRGVLLGAVLHQQAAVSGHVFAADVPGDGADRRGLALDDAVQLGEHMLADGD